DTERAVRHFQDKLDFEMGPMGIKHSQEPLQIIDLRTRELFEKGHVPGAINIQMEELESKFPSLKKDVTTVVYCYTITCHLATKAALLLAENGFPVKELIGGWEEYVKSEQPVESKTQSSS